MYIDIRPIIVAKVLMLYEKNLFQTKQKLIFFITIRKYDNNLNF